MIISVVGEKGGTGKSTIAQHIARYMLHLDKEVILIDTDIPQRTTSDWADTRNQNKNLRPINIAEKSGNILNTLITLANKYEVVVVDCGGHDCEASRSALVLSSLVLLPIRPKRRDLKSLVKMSSLISEARITNDSVCVRVIINQCPTLPTQFARIYQAKAICESYDLLPLNHIISHRNIYDDCEEDGKTVFDTELDSKALTEMYDVCSEVDLLVSGKSNER